jgi:glycosyltransferase involved in cell wall biosynthesis
MTAQKNGGRPKNILILTHWSYRDALVQTYTLPYVNIIRNIVHPDEKIFLVTSEHNRIALTDEEVRTINADWRRNNMFLCTLPYVSMGARKIIASLQHLYGLYKIIRREKISTIHCFCTPAGSIGYLLSKLTGARLVLDSYEPHAESMVENGTWSRNGFAFRSLFLLEKLQSRKADYFIGTSEGMKGYAKKKYEIEVANFFVKPACVDLNKFYPQQKDAIFLKELDLQEKIVCVYAGKLGGIYLKEEVFDFIKECYQYWGERFRFLMLTNASREEVLKELSRVELPSHVVIQKFVKHEEVPKHLSLGDFAINPVKPVPTKQYCTSIKDGEYWATGLPVVITKNISDDSDIINKNEIGYELKELCSTEYFNAIKKIDELILDGSDTINQKIRRVAEQYRSYKIAEKTYTLIYA